MIGPDKIFASLDAVLSAAKYEATIVCDASFSGLTRFANNHIHQNLHTESVDVSIRAKIGDRIGVAATTGLDPARLTETLRRAEAIALAGPPVPGLPPLPGKQDYATVTTYFQKTADFNAGDRAEHVKPILSMSKSNGTVASGLLSSGYSEIAVANTSGLRAYAPLTAAELMVIIGDSDSSGYAAGVSRNIDEIDTEGAGRRALMKCIQSRHRVEIEPGDYEVVLEHAAVGDALEWLDVIGFGSKTYEEGQSFITAKQGQKIVGGNISIRDDGYELKALGVPFDFEGVPKTIHDLLKEGVCGACVHDTVTAARNKTQSTGHALPPTEAASGAFPLNLVMDGGDSNLDEMIASVKRGILVTRFHYINGFIDMPKAVLTGMTRDGTFLIEDGKITAGLPSMRFMQSFLDVFNDVKRLSADRKSCAAWWGSTGAYYVPAMQVGKFRFTGVQKEE
jgi:PmbA protein